jgi:predicted dienelactone hydrolase
MRISRALAALVALAALGLFAAYLMAAPAGPPAGSESALRLRGGPHAVGKLERTFVDAERPTRANGDYAGAPTRTLEGTLWFPLDDAAPHPLVVYSHGFMSMRSEASRYAEQLASHGMLVVAVDYPLTNFNAPGGPDIADAASQPLDVSFVIDQLLGLGAEQRPFRGEIDTARIGAAGLSLGGLTTTLAAFHPVLRDPRISAAVSIAGPSAMFTDTFFANARLPFLMIAGDADAIVDYAANAAPLPGKLVHGGALLTLAGGSHTGFSPMSDGVMRAFGNPDRIGCFALSRTLHIEPRESPFADLGRPDQGILAAGDLPLPCAKGAPERALAAGRQLMITTLALHAFFESHWASDLDERARAAAYLAEGIARDFPEASFAEIAPADRGRAQRQEAPVVPQFTPGAKPPAL